MANRCHHGTGRARGCKHLGLGKFGRMFELEPLHTSDELIEALGKPGGLMDGDGKDGKIPAGYTFFGQFVDHDVTLDTRSALASDRVQDPETLPNLRSPSLDLDCIYGFGPEASPHLYDGEKLLTGTKENPDDLARTSNGQALIGDPRNDENLFVSQLQLLFHRFHNALVERHRGFEAAQRSARYHYQHIVLNDFLRRVCDPDVYAFAREGLYRGRKPLLLRPDAHHGLPMPVEFSVAAYRFGHSMVRSRYAVNRKHLDVELFDEKHMTDGFRPVPKTLVVDWRYFFDLDGTATESRAIDETLAHELVDLPFLEESEPNPNRRSLAFRNLLRGRSLGLPSGQDVAAALADAGYPVPRRPALELGEVAGFDALDAALQCELREETPLFFYVLRESAALRKPGGHPGLGPVGSAIVMEVFWAMLAFCSTSYLHADGHWEPSIQGDAGELTMASVVRFVEAAGASAGSATPSPSPSRKKKEPAGSH